MKRLFSLAIPTLVAFLSLAACDDTTAPPKVPAKPPAPALPNCPTAIAPGGNAEDAEGLNGKVIARRCILGGTETTRKGAEGVKLLNEGDVLGSARLRTDLLSLMKLGTLDDASAYGIPTDDGKGIVLVYALRERPLVADIAFEGAKVLGNDALTAKIPIAKGATLDPQRVSGVAQAARDEYLLRGYGACRVMVVREPAAPATATTPEQVHVKIKIDEGPQWHLAKVDLKGAKRVPDAELRKALNLKGGAPFVQDEIERARDAVSNIYYDRGFVAMHLEVDQKKPDDKGDVAVTFVVDEGDPYVIRNLKVAGAGAPFEKELLEKVVKSRKGQPMNRTVLMADIDKVREFFKAKGKEVNVAPRSEIDPKAHALDLTFEVGE